ncbi:MAG: hypothetical protein GX996_09460 [Firmicutes bacterium]|nr:hypothetical protein [Bacillota bacterium]
MRKPLSQLLLPLFLSLFIVFSILPSAAVATGGKANEKNTAEEQELDVDVNPLLIIEKVNTEKAVAGGIFYITLVIKNHSDYPAFHVLADVSTPGEKEKIFTKVKGEEKNGEIVYDLEKIEGQQTRTLTFPVNIDSKAENKKYNLFITLKSKNSLFKDAPQSSASVTVPVVLELTQPHITVNKVTLDPKAPSARETFTAVFYLDNHSSTEARNVTVELDGKDNFKVIDFTNSKFLKTVTRGAGDFVLFKLQGLEGRKNNTVGLKFSYEHAGDKQSEMLVNLPLGHLEPGSNPFLKVSSFSLQDTPRSGEHLFRLTLENLGQEIAQDISLSLDGGTDIYILDTSNIDYIKNIAGKTKITREYNIGINASQGGAHYPLKVLLSYSDHRGNSYTSEETLGIPSSAAEKAAGTPRVLISKYTLSDEKILAGNIVTLSLFIENTHARPVQNTKVSFKVIEVEDSAGGTIFSPVDSSNSFFIEQIPGRTTLEKSIDLLVDPNAVAKTYIVPVTIEYEDENANSYTVDELVNIPVTQECKLQILDLELPPVAHVGQPVFIGAEFVNVGKAVLNNFIVMLEGDFHKEQASYYVGNLEIGASDFYQGMIYPENEGTLAGTLIFSYIDNNNREIQIEEPFEIDVQPMGEMEHFPGEFPEGHEPGMPGGPFSRIKKILLYAAVPVIIALAAGIYLWRRKAKKKNEEFLDA